MNDDLKKRIYDFVQSRGDDGAMLDDLMQQPDIKLAGLPAVAEAVEALKKEQKLAGFDPVFGYRVSD